MEYPEASGGREAIPEVRAGGAREADKTRREVDGVADNFTEGDEFPEENAAVLEKLEKNGALASTSGVRNFLSRSRRNC